MKRMILLIATLCVGLIGTAGAQSTNEDFLGIPLPDGKVQVRTDNRMEMLSPHDP